MSWFGSKNEKEVIATLDKNDNYYKFLFKGALGGSQSYYEVECNNNELTVMVRTDDAINCKPMYGHATLDSRMNANDMIHGTANDRKDLFVGFKKI